MQQLGLDYTLLTLITSAKQYLDSWLTYDLTKLLFSVLRANVMSGGEHELFKSTFQD